MGVWAVRPHAQNPGDSQRARLLTFLYGCSKLLKMSFLKLNAQLEDLATIRRYVQEQAEAFSFDPDGVYDLTLAVDEVVTNILKHGYQDQQGPIEIEIERQNHFLAIHIRDQAEPFDPTQAPEPDLSLPLEQRPVGRLGLYLTRHSVDQMIYQANPQGGNILTLKKAGFMKSAKE